MTVTVPNVPTPVPSRSDPANFAVRADAYHTALPGVVDAMNMQNAENNALNQSTASLKTQTEAIATSMALTAGVTAWNAVAVYVVGSCVFDPVDFLTYRIKVYGSSGIRPGLDAGNWQLLTGFGDVTLDGSQTLNNKTLVSPVISSGTNNGVLYLNSSKVATSGSALTFDGTTLATTSSEAFRAKNDNGFISFYNTANSTRSGYIQFNATTPTAFVNEVNQPFTWSVSGTEQMRLDTRGNLGLGVTPSAWGSSYKAFESTGASTIDSSNSTGLQIGTNYYHNGTNYVYKSSGMAFRLATGAGFQFFTAPSGTAGNPISFTQAMTLDASGTLSLAAGDFQFNRTSAFLYANGGSGGNVNSGFHLDGSGNTLRMYTGNAERARIDSSGNLIVGATTAANAKTRVASDDARTLHVLLDNTSSSFAGNMLDIEVSRATTSGVYNFITCAHLGLAFRFKVLDSGDVQNTNNSYGAISDVKLKENITDATPKLEGLLKVRVVNYNLKTDPGHKQLGVIAQELEQVFPGMVAESPDRDAAGKLTGETTKAVKYSVFVPMLIKAVQEQQTLIEALTARLTALEGASA